MMIAGTHEIESELLGPTPRPVRHRAGGLATAVHGLIALWMLPFVLIGLGLLGFVAYRTVLWQTQGVPFHNLGAAWLLALFWNALMAFAVRHTLLDARRRRALYATGVPLIGRISGKRLKEYSESETCLITYEYVPTGAIHSLRGETTTRRAEWEAAQIDAPITILYDAKRPHVSVAYRYGEYVVAR